MGASADIISVTVLDDAQVREVVAELAANAKPGTVIAIHSTIADTTAAELAEQLKPQGIHVVDAPVSGGAGAAEKGQLATMVGADRAVYEQIKPAFKHWAALVIHAGEPGAGTRMKLARNMLTFTAYAAAGEAMKLAEAAGLDLQALGRVVRHTDALTGGPGAIMLLDSTAPLRRTISCTTPSPTLAAWGERPQPGVRAGTGDRCGAAAGADRAAAARPGLGVPHPTD